MIHLRLTLPTDQTDRVVDLLEHDVAVCNLAVHEGAARPSGDVVVCDLAREATDRVLDDLRGLGVHEHGGITLLDVDAAPSRNAERAERLAPGAPDDAVVWDAVVTRARSDSFGSWSFYAFFCLATMIAGVAVVTDSTVLVVGAMVVGPEFGTIAALAVALALGRRRMAKRSLLLLLRGFGAAIVAATLMALLFRAFGWVVVDMVRADRPQTGFIYNPDHWSVVVAVLAGAAGVLSTTAGKANALVGVFISVTTVPAAGDISMALGTGAWSQLGGAATQLGLNLVGLLVGGMVTLLVQRRVWEPVNTAQRSRRRERRDRALARRGD